MIRPILEHRGVLTGLALGVMSLGVTAQVLGGPQPPDIDWDLRLGESVPLDARFVDSNGAEIALGEAIGERATILVMLYYECPMLCDLVLDGLVRNLRAVDFSAGADFNLIALTIDPSETTEVASRKRAGYLGRYGRDVGPDGWRFLVGDETEIRRVAEAVGFEYEYVPATGEYAHAAGVTLLTSDGSVSRYLFGIEFPPRDLRFALMEASQGRIGSFVDKFILRCFHYDPANGRYGFAVMNSLRVGGGATVLFLAFFVWRSLRREPAARSARPAEASGV